MGLIALEHSKAAYWADFAAYGVAVVVSSVALPFFGPQGSWPALVALASLGFAGWTLVEYGMHRFVLHGIEPFRRWHDAHHQRPVALISAPTFLSDTLIATLVFLQNGRVNADPAVQ